MAQNVGEKPAESEGMLSLRPTVFLKFITDVGSGRILKIDWYFMQLWVNAD